MFILTQAADTRTTLDRQEADIANLLFSRNSPPCCVFFVSSEGCLPVGLQSDILYLAVRTVELPGEGISSGCFLGTVGQGRSQRGS